MKLKVESSQLVLRQISEEASHVNENVFEVVGQASAEEHPSALAEEHPSADEGSLSRSPFEP